MQDRLESGINPMPILPRRILQPAPSHLITYNLSFKINRKAQWSHFFAGYCATELCHTNSLPSSANPYPKRVRDDSDCATRLCHTGDNPRSAEVSGASSGSRVKRSGTIRGNTRRHRRLNDRQRVLGLFAPDDGPDRPQTIRKGSGLIVRGRMLYVKWRVPKDLQEIVGKTHFVRSLRTGRLSEAIPSLLGNLSYCIRDTLSL
ncbi:DUF6538 domain-containing protein [Asticcacaulis sp. W401b]|uniref:DUF6538 domain-containing protein n=1 Tax=Asticcacaulis sp. W401b TaxID=3388666 RepID=UPI00397105B8